jgi:hypothetical protein
MLNLNLFAIVFYYNVKTFADATVLTAAENAPVLSFDV